MRGRSQGLALGIVISVAAGCSSTPASPASTCADGLTEEDCAKLETIVLPVSLPPARGNAHAEDFNASLLGFHVFFDSRFSKNLNVRCESCHSVDHGFADDVPTPVAGLHAGVRNAPTIFNAARYATFFWDGRADLLWSQPLFALENPNEMGFSRLEIVHLLNAVYGSEYAAAFGALPDFSDLDRFPAAGAPGDTMYDAMSAADKTTVDGVVANLGKALEAYMRNIAAGPSVIDEYLAMKLGMPDGGNYQSPDAGASSAYGAGAIAPRGTASDAGVPGTISAAQEQGMVVFVNSGCLDCHNGPALSDNQFHNLGIPAAAGQPPDPGHSTSAIATLEGNPFNAAGPFFDGPGGTVPTQTPVLGGFRTPSLRNLVSSAPYGHNGSFATLEEIVDFHLQGGGANQTGYVGTVDPRIAPRTVSNGDRAALVEFLKALQGQYPALPWGQWPGGNG